MDHIAKLGVDEEIFLAGDDRGASRDRGIAGPVLAISGLIGWVLIVLIRRWIWAGYDESSDVLLLGLIAGQLATAAVLLAGGAVSVTLSAVGGVLSLLRSSRPGGLDRWSIVGVLASILGVLPIVLVVFTILSHQGP